MKDATVTARIDSELKKKAEDILKKIGLSSSTAIGLFYNNVIINKGLPFKLRLDSIEPVSNAEQKDIEQILRRRSKKDKEIVRSESYEIEL